MANPLIATRDYFRNSVAELKKVTWPSRELTIRYSVLIVVACVAMGAAFAALDFGLQQGVNVLFSQSAANKAPVEAPIIPDLEQTGENNGIQVTSEPEVLTTQPEATPPSDGNTPVTLPPININQ